jgi:hypothetical protein
MLMMVSWRFVVVRDDRGRLVVLTVTTIGTDR